MSRSTIAAYCRIAAAQLPFACAKRLSFDHADDCRAVLEDLASAHPARRFFDLAAEMLAIDSRPLPQHAGREAEEMFRKRERARLYPLIVPLVPLPADTPWAIKDGEHKRTFRGYVLTLQYHRAVADRWSFRRTVAHWRSAVRAAGIEYTQLPPHEKGTSVPKMRREIEAWALAHPIAEARLAALGVRDG